MSQFTWHIKWSKMSKCDKKSANYLFWPYNQLSILEILINKKIYKVDKAQNTQFSLKSIS